MKKFFVFFAALLFSLGANAQFVNGQVLTAPALNNALANPVITGGSINGVNIGAVTAGTGRFTGLNATSIGDTTPGTGVFTTLSASSTVSGTGITSLFASPPAIGGTTPSTGTFTTLNSTGGALNGTVGATTPATGAFTTVTASGTITPSQTAGIVGTTTNNNANAGSVGEYVSNSTLGTSLTSGVSANATSISLTAGDWDVTGQVSFLPAGATVPQFHSAGINTTSATFAGLGTFSSLNSSAGFGSGIGERLSSPVVRISLSATTTVYVVTQATFTTSTMTCDGFISARRVR